MSALETLKAATGIDCANCETCAHLGTDGDGGLNSWLVCEKEGHERYQYLKPFPFRTEQRCWEPCFWSSKFSDLIDGSYSSVQTACKEFNHAIAKLEAGS